MNEQSTYQPSEAEIVTVIDPDWRDHFLTAHEAYQFYAINPSLIADAVRELQE